MRNHRSRRTFLTNVGQGTLLATLGPSIASDLGLVPRAFAASLDSTLTFGNLEPLVCLLQETPIDKLQSTLVDKLRSGESLKNFVAAAALANARTFGGEDYIGFHTFMALAPALKMASLMPKGQAALPVLKVLYRNTNRIQDFGGRKSEVLTHDISAISTAEANQAKLNEAVRGRNKELAESILASILQNDRTSAFESLLPLVQDNPEVHRVVLPYRAWDMQDIVGTEHALTLLRQSLHYCLQNEPHRRADWDEHGAMLSSLMAEFHLDAKSLGTKSAEDGFVEHLADTFCTASATDAARAAASALAEGFSAQVVGEALSLSATMLVLRDAGRPPQWEDRLKPAGSVHGDSRGVHASDAANAWRNMATIARGQSAISCLLIGAWQVARDRGDASNLLPTSLPAKHHLDRIPETDADKLLARLDDAVVNNLQGNACAIAHRYGELGLPVDKIFSTLLRYAVSEDGALHAEKYFNTVWDDFHATRPSLRWRHISSLARVTASEFGKPAAGQAEARQLVASLGS